MLKLFFKLSAALLLLIAGFFVYLGFADQPAPFPDGSTSAARVQAGPYAVASFSQDFVDTARETQAYRDFPGTSERLLASDVWYPAEATRAGPLLVFSHGFTSTRRNGRYLAEHLASHGFVVVAADYPLTSIAAPDGALIDDVVNQPGDVSFLIDSLLALAAESGHALSGKIDASRIGVLGISLGGLTSQLVGFHGVLRDERVGAVLSIAGPTSFLTDDFFAQADVPFLMLSGDLDALVPYASNALPVLEKDPGAELVTVHGGSHTGFSDGTRWVRSMKNTDAIGCWSVQRFVEEDADYSKLFGADDVGIDLSAKDALCEVDPLPETLHVLRQHMIARVVARGFFESTLSPDPGVRESAKRYLSLQLPRELAEVSYARSAGG